MLFNKTLQKTCGVIKKLEKNFFFADGADLKNV